MRINILNLFSKKHQFEHQKVYILAFFRVFIELICTLWWKAENLFLFYILPINYSKPLSFSEFYKICGQSKVFMVKIKLY